MAMRRQLYEWNINRQTTGWPLANPTDGWTYADVAGKSISIFTGDIGNNITMPAETTATQFITIDKVAGSPSWFLSKASVLAAYNTYANNLGILLAGGDLLPTSTIPLGWVVDNAGPATTYDLPAPTVDTGNGTGGTFVLEVPVGAAQTPTGLQVKDTGGLNWAAGDYIIWTNAAIDAIAGLSNSGQGAPGVGALTTYIPDLAISHANSSTSDATSFKNPAFSGGGAAPVYTPDLDFVNPELTYQGTHINPFTSIAGPLMFMQVVINTTNYFDESDGSVGPGLPASSSPYPETASCRSTFDFETPIYVLPGQTWDVRVSIFNDSRAKPGSTDTYNYSSGDYGKEDVRCLVQYTLYDGPDALIATKLVEMGVSVVPENIDWYKQQLLEGTL